MKFNEWVKTYNGKKTDFDGAYGIQCVDLANCFINKCLGLKIGFWPKYAKQFWTERNSSAWIKKNFDFVTCHYKDGELKAGDIGIRTSGTAGHIFIVAEPTKSGKIKYYDQNAGGNGDGMTLRTKQYSQFVITGVLRPKDRKNLPADTKKTDTKKSNSSKKTKTKKTYSYKVGGTYTLLTDVKVRKGAGTNFGQKLRLQLTANGKKNAKAGLYAVLKKGTKVTATAVKNKKDEIWLEIPSGWVCAVMKKRTFIK